MPFVFIFILRGQSYNSRTFNERLFMCFYSLVISKVIPLKIFSRGHPIIVKLNDVAVGAVVDHERNNPAFPLLKFIGELKYISNRSPTEAVKALIVVTNHADVLLASGEKEDKLFLNIVGILILIDHNMSYLRLYLIQDFRMLPEKFIGFHLYG